MKKTLTIALAAAGVLLAGCASEQAPQKSYVRDALEKYVDSGELPGAVSILQKGNVTEIACLGYADVAAKRPVRMDSAFMQCSQTNGFCGVTVAILVEEGKISLDDPVSKYLPEFSELWVQESAGGGVRRLVKAKNALTVRMVMNHTGGFPFELPNFMLMGGWSRRMPLRSVAAVAATVPLSFEPGTKARYSNIGIDIGAAVVEVASGMRWEDFLKARVLDPLGMSSTTFRPGKEMLAGKIELYECKNGKPAKWQECRQEMQRPYGDDRVFPSAGAGLWTTAADQLKFYRMLMNLGLGDTGARILKEETVKELLAKSTRPAGMDGYSLGLAAPEKDGEDAWFGHSGAWSTTCMVNWHKKELQLWAVQLFGEHPWGDARRKAVDKFFSETVDSAAASAYTGRME